MKYQLLPLSARISPYFFIVVTTVWHGVAHCDAGSVKPAFKRNRAPIGGQLALFTPAWWRAGQMYWLRVHDAVKRIAWFIVPDITWS